MFWRVTVTISTILREIRNLSLVLGRFLPRTLEIIWIIFIKFDLSSNTATKSIHHKLDINSLELSSVVFSMHGSKSECSCFGKIVYLCL